MRDQQPRSRPDNTPPASPVSESSNAGYGHLALVVGLTLLVRMPFLTQPGFLFDFHNFMEYAVEMRSHGLSGVYATDSSDAAADPNFVLPPLNMAIIAGVARVFEFVSGAPMTHERISMILKEPAGFEAVLAAILFRLPALLADVATVVMLWLVIRSRLGVVPATGASLLLGLNPACVYDTAVWGQIDSIHTLAMIASLELARRRRLIWMCVAATIAVLLKQQTLMLAPIWAAMILAPAATGEQLTSTIRRLAAGVATAFVTAATIVVPFVGTSPMGMIQQMRSAVGFYPFVHLNGFSMWFLTNPMNAPRLGGRLMQTYLRDDAAWLPGITPRGIGLVLLCGVSLLVFVLLIRHRGNAPTLFWAARIMPLAFFVLPTQMHERYLYPAIAIVVWTVVRSRSWFVSFAIISAVCFTNMVWVWSGPAEGGLSRLVLGCLHEPVIGMSIGTILAAVMVGLLIYTLVTPPRSERTGAS